MSAIEKAKDTVTTEILKTYLPPLLTLISTLVAGLVPRIRCTLLSLPPSLLLGLLAISLVGASGAVAYIFILRKQKKELQELHKLSTLSLRSAFTVYWDEYDNPICPRCMILLQLERVGTDLEIKIRQSLPFAEKPPLICIKCNQRFPLLDDNNISLSLAQAKAQLPKRKAAP